MTQTTTDPIGVLVERLARPHASGGRVIEHSVILAEGANAKPILNWISDHDGVADSSSPSIRGGGVHARRPQPPAPGSAPRRFVLPARAFTQPRGDENEPSVPA